jgi:predicted outer membrane lipoprotein
MNRRRLFRVAAAGFVVNDMFWRLFHDARPIDVLILAVDFLVLLAILWFEIREERRRKRETDTAALRESQVALRRYKVFFCLGNGQELLRTVPLACTAEADKQAQDWGDLVKAWISQTSQSLRTFSLLAEAAFLDDSARSTATYPNISQHAQHFYSILNHKMASLRSIGENPDTYLTNL